MRLSLHFKCFGAYFSDRTGEVCLLSESVQNRPWIVLGRHHHVMTLAVPEVRAMLPHLQRFVATGRMAPHEEDYQI